MEIKEVQQNTPRRADENKIHRRIIWALLILMTGQGIYLLFEQQWLALCLVFLIIATLFAPLIFRKKLGVEIPAEFHITAVLFTFAALYLGEIQSFYIRFWWWDTLLHTTAGFLMGILGFLLVYTLNQVRTIDLNLNPGFIAFFAFLFSITIGTMWEIFEFGMDQIFGLNMQKPMLGDPSGLTDTMWDMIVNAIGAFIISITGWRYLKLRENFFVKKLIAKFIHKNPRIFKR